MFNFNKVIKIIINYTISSFLAILILFLVLAMVVEPPKETDANDMDDDTMRDIGITRINTINGFENFNNEWLNANERTNPNEIASKNMKYYKDLVFKEPDLSIISNYKKLYNKSIEYYADQNYTKAAETFERLFQTDNQYSYTAGLYLAKSFYHRNKYDKAINILNTLTDYYGEMCSEYYYIRIKVLLKQNKQTEAKKCFITIPKKSRYYSKAKNLLKKS